MTEGVPFFYECKNGVEGIRGLYRMTRLIQRLFRGLDWEDTERRLYRSVAYSVKEGDESMAGELDEGCDHKTVLMAR